MDITTHPHSCTWHKAPISSTPGGPVTPRMPSQPARDGCDGRPAGCARTSSSMPRSRVSSKELLPSMHQRCRLRPAAARPGAPAKRPGRNKGPSAEAPPAHPCRNPIIRDPDVSARAVGGRTSSLTELADQSSPSSCLPRWPLHSALEAALSPRSPVCHPGSRTASLSALLRTITPVAY
jgi:hypothetical protein